MIKAKDSFFEEKKNQVEQSFNVIQTDDTFFDFYIQLWRLYNLNNNKYYVDQCANCMEENQQYNLNERIIFIVHDQHSTIFESQWKTTKPSRLWKLNVPWNLCIGLLNDFYTKKKKFPNKIYIEWVYYWVATSS